MYNAQKYINLEKYGYLQSEIGSQLVDRLLDIKKTFNDVLEINKRSNFVNNFLNSNDNKKLLNFSSFTSSNVSELTEQHKDKYDLIISNLSLHWENDLPETFKKLNYILKPDGVLLGAIFCDDTLFELKNSLMIAEQERQGGFTVRTSPMVRTADICSLLSSSKFRLPTVDTLTIEIEYDDIFELTEHLWKMGETNASFLSKNRPLKRDSLIAASSIYDYLYPGKEKENSILSTFQVGFFIGWKHHDSQPLPKERGSGKINMKIISSQES